MVCPCGVGRSPAGSGGGRVYISACAGGITLAEVFRDFPQL